MTRVGLVQALEHKHPSDKYGTLRTKAFFERSLKLIIGRI
jgi:hypothetical protein